jgi:general secretion pathway protein B
MSFILDALKKSESDRARQSGPALYEVKVPPPRHGLPLWALVVVALLAVNLVIGVWMLLRHGPKAAPDGAPASATVTAGSTPAPPPAAAVTVPTQPVSAQLPPAATMPAAAETAAARGHEPPAAAAQESTNPEDYEPAAPAPPASQGPESHVRRGTADGVPLYQEAATQQGASLPQLRLDLHVYATQPSQRFVMINMHKLREGDTTPEGARVESITPDGAVLSYNGSRFLLTRD